MPTLEELRRWARGEPTESFGAPPVPKRAKPESKDTGPTKSQEPASAPKLLKYKISDDGTDALLKFGKHRGSPLSAIKQKDPGYLDWLVGQTFVPDDLKDVIQFQRGHAFPRASK